MKYNVIWRPATERHLARLWSAATDKDAISQAVNTIDSLLSREPSAAGESRSGDTRILVVEPLIVYFDVIEANCTVAVWAVWRTRPRKKSS